MKRVLLLLCLPLCAASLFAQAAPSYAGAEETEPTVKPTERAELPLLAPLFVEHAVLQRDKPLPVWGWTKAGTKVEVALAGNTASALAGADGRWEAVLPAMPAGGPHELTVRVGGAGGQIVKVPDVLLGDVWLCSGQSNMAFYLRNSTGGKEAMAAAANPKLRIFNVKGAIELDPLPVVGGKWSVSAPDSVGTTSAVGYFFGSYLQSELKVPIGIIHASYGGSTIVTWLPLDRLKSDAKLAQSVKEAEARPDLEKIKKNQFPTGLYNGMIHGLAPFALKGVIWYQGESPVYSPDFNRDTLWPMLIADWREHFRDPALWWGVVQLPNYGKPDEPAKPSGGGWPVWRNVQAKVVEKTPNAFMAVTIDVGEVDVHPRNKRPVGERLAKRALAVVYGAKDPATGPLLVLGKVEGGAVKLTFKNTAGGLVLKTKDGAPSAFALKGADGGWQFATAKVEGDSVVLNSPEVPQPTAAMYAGTNQLHASLFGTDGLPAAPWSWKQ